MLYSRYANPKELIQTYIKRRRFGEFVYKVIDSENQRRNEEAEKENENRLWIAYVHSMSEKPFTEWKMDLLKKQPASLSMTDEQVEATKQQARGILQRFSPK